MIAAAMLAFLQSIANRPERFMEELLYIRDKRDRIVPLRLNPIQLRTLQIRRETIRAGKPKRWIILKARKQGQTTLWQALNYFTVTTIPNTRCLTLGHESDATEQIFQMADLFWRKSPPQFRARRLTDHDKRDLEFPGMNSMFYVGTAGKKSVGRGTTITRYQWTEVAHSPGTRATQEELEAGLDEAAQEGEGVWESTPNGVGDLFHVRYMEAKDGANVFTPIFFHWFDDPTYRHQLSDVQALDLRAQLTDEEKDLIRVHKLDLGQISWRRAMKKKRGRLAAQEFPEDDVTCFLLSGHCFFDRTYLEAAKLRAGEPIESTWPDEMGIPQLRVWEKPIPGHRYVAAGDVAEGVPGGNYSCLAIMDVETMHQVATLRVRMKPEDFSKKSCELATLYNLALLGFEANNHGHSANNTAMNVVAYRNLYWHTEFDATGSTSQKVGWPTNTKTRPIALDGLRSVVESGEMPLRDLTLIDECMTFVKQEGKRETYAAEDGCMDDEVLAWSIVVQLRLAMLGLRAEVPVGFDIATTVPAGGTMYPSSPGRMF